jgi:hypothetical protein
MYEESTTTNTTHSEKHNHEKRNNDSQQKKKKRRKEKRRKEKRRDACHEVNLLGCEEGARGCIERDTHGAKRPSPKHRPFDPWYAHVVVRMQVLIFLPITIAIVVVLIVAVCRHIAAITVPSMEGEHGARGAVGA